MPRRLNLGGRRRTFAAIAALLLAVVASPANGFIGGVIAYQRDTSVFYYPLFVWAAQQLDAGRFPLWTPEIMGGYPLFADSEIGLASPAVLLALLSLPPEAGFVALRILHIGIAALGAYVLAQAWRLPPTARVIAGLTFALGSFLQAHLHHENIVRTAAWLPLLLACTEFAIRSETARHRARWIVAASVCLGMASVGLHPQILTADILMLGAYAALRSVLQRRLSVTPVLIVALSMPLGLALAAVQLAPLTELAGLSARGTNTFPYTEVAGHSLTPYGLVQVVLPFVFRDTELRQWGLWAHWESYLYVGLVPFLLAVVALRRALRPEVAIWLLLAVGGLLLALGQYLPIDVFGLLRSAPGLSWLRAPGRFSVIVDLALAMLAAHGLLLLLARARTSPLRVSLPLLGVLVAPAIAFAAVVIGGRYVLQQAPDIATRLIETHYLSLPKDLRWANATDVYKGLLWSTDLFNLRTGGALIALVLIGAVLIAWQVLPSRRLRSWPGWPLVLTGMTAMDLLIFSWSIHPREALSTIAAPHPVAAAVRQLVDGLEPSERPTRVLASPVLNQVAADRLAPLGLHEAGGYSSLDPSRHRLYFRHIRQVDDDLLDLLNVRFVLDPAQYGTLANYRGVEYLPANALLRSASHDDLGEETFHIPASIRPSEIRIVSALSNGAEVPQGQVVATLTLRSESGQVLARSALRAGVDVMDWAWDDLSPASGVRHVRVEPAGDWQEPLDAGGTIRRVLSFTSVGLGHPQAARTLEMRNQTPRGQLVIFGAALVDANGQVQQLFGRFNKSKYREVLRSDGIVVLENQAAFPRAFLVQSSRLAQPGVSAIDLMESRTFTPREEVILAADTPPTTARLEPATISGRAALLRPGKARVERYDAQEVSVRVTTPQDTFLVLSDAYYPGWRAYVDGAEQPILRGNLMFRVVQVPEGVHEVVFRFQPMSVLLGLRITLAALAVSVVVLLLSLRHRPR